MESSTLISSELISPNDSDNLSILINIGSRVNFPIGVSRVNTLPLFLNNSISVNVIHR